MHIRRALICPGRLFAATRRSPFRSRPEFPRVNQTAGSVPIQPELSGLALRRPGIPARVTRLLISLAYRWQPSGDYLRRQEEMAAMNPRLRRRSRLPLPPPFLAYDAAADLTPTRLQPLPGMTEGEDLRDLAALAAELRHRSGHLLQPATPALDPEALIAYRPLLPRRYRHFLRHSPYPRIAGVSCALLVAGGGLWFSRMETPGIAATGRTLPARQIVAAELERGRAFGLDARDMRTLEDEALRLSANPSQGLTGDAVMVRMVQALERRELAVWTRREGAAYAALLTVTLQAQAAGLHPEVPQIAACTTITCLRRAVAEQRAERHAIAVRIGTNY